MFFALQACVSGWVGVCLMREVDCILYGMFLVKKKKKKKKKAKLPFTPQCSLLSCTVQHCMTAFCRAAQRSLMLSVFQHHLTVSPTESIVYWTQAYVLLPFFKRKKSKAVTNSETHCYGRGVATVCYRPLFRLRAHATLDLFFFKHQAEDAGKCTVTKRCEHKHVKKIASRIQRHHECLHNPICPCIVNICVLCEDVRGSRCLSPWKIRVSVLQTVCRRISLALLPKPTGMAVLRELDDAHSFQWKLL